MRVVQAFVRPNQTALSLSFPLPSAPPSMGGRTGYASRGLQNLDLSPERFHAFLLRCTFVNNS